MAVEYTEPPFGRERAEVYAAVMKRVLETLATADGAELTVAGILDNCSSFCSQYSA